MAKYSKNKESAVILLEFLSSSKAQKLYGDVNYEYPINNIFETPKKLSDLGSFREDKLLLEKIAILSPKAQEIIDIVYW